MKSAVRKVVKVGGRSYAVIVPKKWARLLKIGSGDPVYIVLNDDGTLSLAPLRTSGAAAAEQGSHAMLSLASVDSRSVRKAILALYAAGLSTVTVSAEASPSLVRLPQELVKLEEFSGKTVINFRELRADPAEVIETMVHKVREAFRLFSENLDKLSNDVWEKIHRIEDELDVMTHLATRSAIKKVVTEALSKGVESEVLSRSILSVLAAKVLEDLSDCVDRSVHRIKEFSAISRDYRDLYAKLSDLANEAMMCYLHSCSVDEIVANLNRASKFRGELKELMAESAPPLLPLLSEVEVAITLLEDLLETALLIAYG